MHRFPNGAIERDGHLRWDMPRLFEEVLVGLRELGRRFPAVVSIGIDTWAVDYGLLDAEGRLIEQPIAYRDDRTDAVIDEVHARTDPAELYAVTGLQFLPFNTLYQLAAEQHSARWPRVAQVLLLPDLLGYWLTGERRTESTNASTTGLLDARSRSWATELLQHNDLPARTVRPPGRSGRDDRPVVAGDRRPDRSVAAGASWSRSGRTTPPRPWSAVPAREPRFRLHLRPAPGHWSESSSTQPVLTEASRAANFTNEGGVDGRVRYLRNVGGLWLLQESMRTWRERRRAARAGRAAREAAEQCPAGGPTFDVDAAELLAPGDMPERIARIVPRPGATRAGDGGRARPLHPRLTGPGVRRTVATAEELSRSARSRSSTSSAAASQNALLCQLTADRTGRPGAGRAGGGHRAGQRAGPGPGRRLPPRRPRPGCARWSPPDLRGRSGTSRASSAR